MRRAARTLGRGARRFFETFHLLPIAATLGLLFLLAFSGQMQELYLRLAMAPAAGEVIATLAAFIGISVLLSLSFLSLSGVAVDIVWTARAKIFSNVMARSGREVTAMFIAFVPFAAAYAGWRWASEGTRQARMVIADEAARAPGSNFLDDGAGALQQSVAALDAAELRAVAMTMLGVLATFLLRHVIRRYAFWRRAAAFVLLSLVAALIIGPLVATELPQGPFGPIAVSLTAIAAAYTILWGIAYLSFRQRLPVLSLLAALYAGFAAYHFYYAVEIVPLAQPTPGLTSDAVNAAKKSENGLATAFSSWLGARPDRQAYQQRGKRYPVFIVAAQGGGIYAAAQTAMFLARMQDRCATFASHTFAVSAVSGGAVGAAIFEAALSEQRNEMSQRQPCAPAGKTENALQRRAAHQLLADHLSPVARVFLGDVTLGQFLTMSSTRAAALARSLTRAQRPADGLAAPYDGLWQQSGSSPALLLNTTSVETAHRVVFSPFSLKDVGEGTLHAFQDLGANVPVSLAEAAVASARFPGLMPAFQVARTFDAGTAPHQGFWNFVDGGYVDNSGSATALDVYRTLLQYAPADVDLHVILLTSHIEDITFARITGTPLVDTVAPLSALLRAREQLSELAVTRTRAAFQGPLRDNLHAIALDQEVFQLALGWTLSPATFDIVSLGLGDPALCPGGRYGGAETAAAPVTAQRRTRFIGSNSCAMEKIRSLLQP